MRNFRITVEGKPYLVTVEEVDATDTQSVAPVATQSSARPHAPAVPATPAAAVSPSAPAAHPVVSGGGGDIVSPLAGTVVSVDVSVGQVVQQGQAVMVLEAMKMNTHVTASRSGTVNAIHVTPGVAVSEGQLLLSTG